jgi:DNA-directed RNA polymerase subunit RPC12/RpoP
VKPTAIPLTAGGYFNRLKVTCAIFGHKPGNSKSCECVQGGLAKGGAYTHIRHILSCFLGGHQFIRLTDRDNLHEYVCHECGHQLLVPALSDPFEAEAGFMKRPRYWCSLFGHHVRPVSEREGLSEYACACGHSFLKPEKNLSKIKHPLICTLAGHLVRFLLQRDGYAEYVCKWCGHTFCYREA